MRTLAHRRESTATIKSARAHPRLLLLFYRCLSPSPSPSPSLPLRLSSVSPPHLTPPSSLPPSSLPHSLSLSLSLSRSLARAPPSSCLFLSPLVDRERRAARTYTYTRARARSRAHRFARGHASACMRRMQKEWRIRCMRERTSRTTAVYLDTDGSLNQPAASNKHHLLARYQRTPTAQHARSRARTRLKRLTNGRRRR